MKVTRTGRSEEEKKKANMSERRGKGEERRTLPGPCEPRGAVRQWISECKFEHWS